MQQPRLGVQLGYLFLCPIPKYKRYQLHVGQESGNVERKSNASNKTTGGVPLSLRLILGRAGSGKSTHIYREINRLVADRPDGPPLWLLVPEQATSQAERNLADGGVVPGLMRARVVSFQRLAYQSLHEVGGAALVQISELGRRMILRHVLEEKNKSCAFFTVQSTSLALPANWPN